jgi:hypothetical protein
MASLLPPALGPAAKITGLCASTAASTRHSGLVGVNAAQVTVLATDIQVPYRGYRGLLLEKVFIAFLDQELEQGLL